MTFFFFNDTATTEIYTLSLHDALPIWPSTAPAIFMSRSSVAIGFGRFRQPESPARSRVRPDSTARPRSEEHTSELQSQSNLACRLLLEKKKRLLRALNHRSKPTHE